MSTRHTINGGGSGKRREDLLQVRISTVEKEAFEKAAELAGLAVSAWVRERLRRVASQELIEAGHKKPFQ